MTGEIGSQLCNQINRDSGGNLVGWRYKSKVQIGDTSILPQSFVQQILR